MSIKRCTVVFLLACGLFAAIHYADAMMPKGDAPKEMQATQASDNPARIQALMAKMKLQMEKNDDSFADLIRETEQLASSATDSTYAALLHSMTAEMYQQYYNANRWTIDRRTELLGHTPEDIREWTANLFASKVKEHIGASLLPLHLLQQTPAEAYKALLTKGKNSPTLSPTMYEFLLNRAIELQPTDELYQQLLVYRRAQPEPKARLLDELNYLAYRFSESSMQEQRRHYEASLDSLMTIYKGQEISTEIRIAQAQLLQQHYYDYNSAQADSVQARLYALCREGIALHPNYMRTVSLRNTLNNITTPQLRTEVAKNVYPGKSLSVRLKYTNVPQVTIHIHRSTLTPEQVNPYTGRQNGTGELIKEYTYTLSTPTPYQEMDTVIQLPAPSIGLYECVVSTGRGKGQIKINSSFSVSRLAAVHRTTSDGKQEVWVTDFETGKPIPQASLMSYKVTGEKFVMLETTLTNAQGLATLPTAKTLAGYRATLADDRSMAPTLLYAYYNYSNNISTAPTSALTFFTDRAIYRPGQTLFFKGIAYEEKEENPRVIANQSYTVSLRNANGEEVVNKTFRTNAFGSFNGEFTLPRTGLSGTYTLSAENGSTQIHVEEYKRPTFELAIDSLTQEVSFNHPLTLNGKAQSYAGLPLQSGTVTWRIDSRPLLLRNSYEMFSSKWIGGNYRTEQVANGTATVDKQGRFALTFTPRKETGNLPIHQRYELTATLTDSRGETQEVRYTFAVGETEFLLQVNLPEVMNRASAHATIQARTANDQLATTSGTYTLYILPDSVKKNPRTDAPRQAGNPVANGTFATDKPIPAAAFAALSSGRYRLEAKATDSKGKEVKAEEEFVLYTLDDKRPPVFSPTWLIPEKTNCSVGEEALVTFGTSHRNVTVLYELFSNGLCTERRLVEMDNENRQFRIPFLATYGQGVTASFTFVKEGELYPTVVPITRALPNRELTIRPETFRNTLLPGGREQWTFRIQRADSTAIQAEVLAGMYDASLDQLMPFDWYFRPITHRPFYVSSFATGASFDQVRGQDFARLNWLDVPDYTPARLNWYGALDRVGRGGRVFATRSSLVGAVNAKGAMLKECVAISNDQVVVEASAAAPAPQAPPMALRKNFAETALFFPHLVTDSAGRVTVGFTAPDSHTTWKLQLLAHTDDLRFGYLTQEVIARKPLMVQPHLPRFMRRGDRATLGAQVVNASNKTISGRVTLELFDPETQQPIVCLTKGDRPFELSADSSAVVEWNIDVPDHVGLIGCRIVAQTESGSDGEQHLIPLLSDQLLITESTPFSLFGEGEKRIPVGMPKGATPLRYTLELSANPVWYAVQALPTLAQSNSNDVLSRFAAYYSQTLAGFIASAHPRIRTIIDQWASQGGDASTLLSNLEKNPELKSLLLEETPWVAAAGKESEQKARLSLLFDLNRSAGQQQAAMQQLVQEQNEEGSWSWFKGMPGSRAITQAILKGMSQLTQLNAIQFGETEKRMQIKALAFLDKCIAADYKRLTTTEKGGKGSAPTAEQIDYLFMRSAYRDIPEPGDSREAIRYYTAQAARHWERQSLHGMAQTAQLLHRNGDKATATKVISWLRKRATTSDELGMYWANNRTTTNYLTSTVETHCQLMAAFHEIAPDAQVTDRMKFWLLAAKRTQQWESTPATVNAIHALLLTGGYWLDERNTCSVQWGERTFSTTQGTKALGYLKEEIAGTEINNRPEMQNLVIRKEGKAPAWGAVYRQYYQTIDKVEKQKGALHIEKQLFLETNSGSGLQLVPVGNDHPLRVGDKVTVRLVVRADRDMDYVALTDLRAGCFEPAQPLSGNEQRDGVWFYRSPKDLTENFYFSHLPQGTFVLEYGVYVVREGRYSGGISTLQCLYAPEFVAHTEGGSLDVVR